jgi:hypothetical protein
LGSASTTAYLRPTIYSNTPPFFATYPRFSLLYRLPLATRGIRFRAINHYFTTVFYSIFQSTNTSISQARLDKSFLQFLYLTSLYPPTFPTSFDPCREPFGYTPAFCDPILPLLLCGGGLGSRHLVCGGVVGGERMEPMGRHSGRELCVSTVALYSTQGAGTEWRLI